MEREEIFTRLRPLVADSLALKPEEISLGSRLIPDLGADSLDFIDMIFLMEKQFGVKIREGEMDFLSRLDFTSPDARRDGYLTRETVDRLAEWLPSLREREDLDRVAPKDLLSLITVETLCIMVERKLQGL